MIRIKPANQSKTAFFLVCVFLNCLPFPAYAYLDPGTGSLILQALIGGVAAAGAFASLYYQKIKLFLRRVISRSHDFEEGE